MIQSSSEIDGVECLIRDCVLTESLFRLVNDDVISCRLDAGKCPTDDRVAMDLSIERTVKVFGLAGELEQVGTRQFGSRAFSFSWSFVGHRMIAFIEWLRPRTAAASWRANNPVIVGSQARLQESKLGATYRGNRLCTCKRRRRDNARHNHIGGSVDTKQMNVAFVQSSPCH